MGGCMGAGVLLVHGQGLDHRSWSDVAARLGCPWRAIDLPGHGARPWPHGAAADSFATAVLEARRELTWDEVVVAGHSLGAMAVFEAACRRPEAFAAVVVVGMMSEPSAEQTAMQLGFAEALEEGGWSEAIEDAVLARWLTPQTLAALPDPRVWLRARVDPDAARVARLCRVLAERPPLLDRVPAALPPVVAVTSDEDSATPLSAARPLLDAARARVVTLPGGHLTPIEQPERLAHLLEQLVSEVDARAGRRASGGLTSSGDGAPAADRSGSGREGP
jgi:pimeloyl-ACP methyl ester carboxylesterase